MRGSVLLAALPALAFALQYRFAVVEDVVDAFVRHPSAFYADWLFVPFNLVVADAVVFAWDVFFSVLAGSAALAFVAVVVYQREYVRRDGVDFNFTGEANLTRSGLVHAVFGFVELNMVGHFLIGAEAVFASYVCCAVLLLYFFLSWQRGVASANAVTVPDVVYYLGGVVVTVVRVFTL